MILKKKVLIYIAAITFINTGSYTQNFELTEGKKYKSLIGEIYFLTLFVETPEGNWEDEEKNYYYQEVIKGQNWIIEEGMKYDQQILFNNEQFFYNQAEVFFDDIEELTSLELYNEVLEKLQYESFYHFKKANNLILHPNKLRILLLIKNQRIKNGFDYWEKKKSHIMKVYCSNTYGLLTDQYRISHEILYHFGAWDLCYKESQNFSKAFKAKKVYPKSIMTRHIDWDHEVIIDDLTAWRIGWYYGETQNFKEFEPDRRTSFEDRRPSFKFKIRKE